VLAVIPAKAGIHSARKRHDGAPRASSPCIPKRLVIPAKAGTYTLAVIPAKAGIHSARKSRIPPLPIETFA